VRLAAAEIQLVALCLLAAGQSAASAAPAAADPAGCSAVLAGVWPGTISDRSGTRRVFSDAYDSFLDRRPACEPAEP